MLRSRKYIFLKPSLILLECNLFCCACHDGCRQGNNPNPTACQQCQQNCNDEIDACIADQICTECACSPTNAECSAIFIKCSNACESEYGSSCPATKKVKRATADNSTALGVCNLPGADPATRQLIIASILPKVSNARCGAASTDPDCTDGLFIRLDRNGNYQLSATEYAVFAMEQVVRKHYSEFEAYMEHFLTYLSPGLCPQTNSQI